MFDLIKINLSVNENKNNKVSIMITDNGNRCQNLSMVQFSISFKCCTNIIQHIQEIHPILAELCNILVEVTWSKCYNVKQIKMYLVMYALY